MAMSKRPTSEGPRTGMSGPAAVGLSSATAAGGAQTIETLKKRHDELSKERTRAETNLENARGRLEDLKKEASEKYGTDDLAQLNSQLAAMKEENERKRSHYQRDLDAIEAALAQIEREYQQNPSERGEEGP